MKTFQVVLVHDLDEDGFADMYAQTIAYGLLSARITNPKHRIIDHKSMRLPLTTPFLRSEWKFF